MKMVSELYGRHAGSDIYVVGTGTSLRVFPTDFFKGKTVIGLNMAWKLIPVDYCITIHPDLNIPEFMPNETPHPEITWVVGNKKAQLVLNREQTEFAEKHFFFFNYHGKPNTQPSDQPSDSGRCIEWLERIVDDNLYVWSSISQAGVNLAANLGAKNIVLVGCDNTSLLSNHHAHDQHTRWKKVDPDHRYNQYYEGLCEVRSALKKRNINLLSLTPFLKLDAPEKDFLHLCNEFGVPRFIENQDMPVTQKGQKRFGSWRRLKGIFK
jgi:hypothetical protein